MSPITKGNAFSLGKEGKTGKKREKRVDSKRFRKIGERKKRGKNKTVQTLMRPERKRKQEGCSHDHKDAG